MAATEHTMIDRVAIAISGAPFPTAASRRKARAAIEALREPSPQMCVAGGQKCEAMLFEGEGTGVIFTDMGTVFTTMIDAILNEEPRT